MSADPLVLYFAAMGIDAQALVLALAAVIVGVAWFYMLSEIWRGFFG